MALSCIVSALIAVVILFDAFEIENQAKQQEHSLDTIEVLRWVLETELEEISIAYENKDLLNSSPLEFGETAANMGLKFLQIETKKDQGEWIIFHGGSIELSERMKNPNATAYERLERLNEAQILFENYRNQLQEYIESEIERAHKRRGLVSEAIFLVFFIHLLLFWMSVRFDLFSLKEDLIK